MAQEVTIFIPQFEDALYQSFDPIRAFAKQDSVGAGAKTVSIPVSGGLTFANINSDSAYPRTVQTRSDTNTTYDLTKIELDPFKIGNWEEFVSNASLRQSIINEVSGILGAFAIRTILNGFWNDTIEMPTTGTNTYTNRHTETGCKVLTLEDVATAARMLDLQKVPRDNDRYLVLDPEMYSGLVSELADAGWLDVATQAFSTGMIPKVHGFTVVMLPEVAIATGDNAAVVDIKTAPAATHLNVGYALHKNFVGFAASNMNLYLQENAPEYYGSVISGDFYAGGKYRRATAIGCVTIYEDI